MRRPITLQEGGGSCAERDLPSGPKAAQQRGFIESEPKFDQNVILPPNLVTKPKSIADGVKWLLLVALMVVL